MEAEELLQQIQDQMEDFDDEIFALLLMAQMNQQAAASMDSAPQHGGSREGRRANLNGERHVGHLRIYKDYFAGDPVYDDVLFRRRFRMRRSVFVKIMSDLSQHDPYFTQRRDAVGLAGLPTIQKCSAAIRMLAYGVAVDALYEYCRLGESTTMECLKKFVRGIRELYESHHLRQPSRAEIEGQMEINKARGFPRMFASLDCMHYDWKNCPTAWQGQFQDKDGNRSIILEAIVDQSLHIWHAFFGLPGSNNDLNVLARSPLVVNMLRGPTEDMNFTINGTQYPRYYLLTHGIYPKWAIFQQSIHEPSGEKRKYYAKMQEALRKDVKRAFGVLQIRFSIVANPCRMWKSSDITDILIACVILHNMIIDDEGTDALEPLVNQNPALAFRRHITPLQYLDASDEIEDVSAHFTLRNDLIEHLWQLRGEQELS